VASTARSPIASQTSKKRVIKINSASSIKARVYPMAIDGFEHVSQVSLTRGEPGQSERSEHNRHNRWEHQFGKVFIEHITSLYYGPY
jgi:hypothetical protein